MKKLTIITDAWDQTNGVVRTLNATVEQLNEQGWSVRVIHPGYFPTFNLPGYPEIKIVWNSEGLEDRIDNHEPDFIHIATEGPLGWAARAICKRRKWNFTTAYHTDFPGYLREHYRIPERISYWVLRKFHGASSGVMVSTKSVADKLNAHKISNIRRWGRGVDTDVFRPRTTPYEHFDEPVLLNVGRVSKEKNLEAFFSLDIPGTKVVVGDGPMLEEYRARFPDVQFMGKKTGEALASYYAMADVMVFPSVTDTFGLVIIESLACGTPVAAYPVQGPVDILTKEAGSMNEDLALAVREALTKDRSKVAEYGQSFTWENATFQFIIALERKIR